MWRRETCLAPAGNPTTTPWPSTQYPCHSLSHIRSFGAPTIMGTIGNTYKFVVGQLSDLDAKGTKIAVKQCNVKDYVGFNSLGIWSSGVALMNPVAIFEFVQISDHQLPKKHTAPFRWCTKFHLLAE